MTHAEISPAPRAVAIPMHRIAVSAAFLANGFLIGSWAPEIPLFAARLEISEATLGIMILIFGLGAVAAMPVVGRVIGRAGSRLPMLVLHLLMVPAMPLVVLAPGLVTAGLAVALMGLATGGMDVAMNANAVAVERRRPRAIMSSCHGFWSVGGLLGAGLGGFIIAALGALGHSLVVAAVILALWVLVARGALADHAVAPQEASGTAPTPVAAEASRAGVLKAVAVGLFALFAMIPEGAAIDWSAVYLRQELGAGAAASGLAFAAFSLTMACFRFAGDGIRDRFGAVATARVCSAVAAVGLLAVGLADALPVTLLGFALMGIGLSNMVPIAFSAAGNIEGLKPGSGLSIVSALGYSGILLAPSAIGFVAEHSGFRLVFLSLAALLVVTFLAAGLVRGADHRTQI
ncbi:MFS transporter [Aureimonas sp. SA4125]|uniref:MFS transporter n=1 Tax=Aureimonas sp. SA4125 TaxID=2826993 RepID=UPI001CC393C0|nr:MFS transporter [Aureimonas sp. SA4125]